MRLLLALACVIAGLALAGCQVVIKPEPTALAFYNAIRDGDGPKMRALAAPQMITPQFDAQVAAVRRFIPTRTPNSVKGLGRNMLAMPDGQTLDTTDVYDFGDRRVVALTSMHRSAASEAWRVQAFNVRVFLERDLAANRFALSGKSPVQYFFLAATIAAPLAMIAALIKVIRRKRLKRKWLWGVAAFAGAVTLHMNWTTGQVDFQLLSLQLLGAGAMTSAPGLSPWVLTFTLPIGAALILVGLWANPRRAKNPPVEPAESF
jgi:hypothetical protein